MAGYLSKAVLDLKDCRGEMNQVGFGPYDIQFVCGSWIFQNMAAGMWEYHAGGKIFSGYAEKRENREALLDVVGKDIVDIQAPDEYTLELILSHVDKIVLKADKSDNEWLSIINKSINYYLYL